MSEFDDWNKYNLGYTGKQAFEAGQQSQQAKIDKLLEKHSEEKRILHNVIEMNQDKIDELKKKYDAMYNAFIVADDFRKEWHESYMSARKERDELQVRVGEAVDYIAESGGVNLTSEIALNYILKGNKDEN